MRNKTQKAFSLVELLITLIIIGILGGGAVMAMWFFLGSFLQMDDYTMADTEIEGAFRLLSREFALIGLGMPNNRTGQGSFAMSFYEGANFNNSPIMALFGDLGSDWGGPVTVSRLSSGTEPLEPGRAGDAFVGPELYYAWGVPTGVRAGITNTTRRNAINALNQNVLSLNLHPPSGADTLRNFSWGGRNIGLLGSVPATNPGRNMRTWLAFPTLRLPMRALSWGGSGGAVSLDVIAAPVPSSALSSLTTSPDVTVSMSRTIMGLDEIHLIQAARLYRDVRTNELKRVVFGEDYEAAGGNYREEVLASNIVALQFHYHPVDRLLTMYIVARGTEMNATGAGHPVYPSWMPADQRVSADNARFRTLAKTMTWRIRN